MTDDTNPHESAILTAKEEDAYTYLQQGVISSVNENQTSGAIRATVQETTVPADQPIPIIPGVHGDLYIPPEGAPVLVSPIGPNDYAIIGSPVPTISTPALKAGERVISHPKSGAHVKFNNDGSLDIKGDSEIRINGGTEGAITNVQVNTQKDADGHVTSVSLDITRESTIKI